MDAESSNRRWPRAAVSPPPAQSGPWEDLHYVVALGELKEYTASMQANGSFKTQYEKVRTGQQKPWDVGSKPENKPKNRYSDLLAYDETRVILEKLPNDPNSDYINANYIDGYKKPKEYIATQGPLEKTVPDFWRMIWQENVRSIIMLANVIENGKKKCEKYWPDSVETYGQIKATLLHERVFVDNTIRTLHLEKADQSTPREVRQFHFTGWPDHGVPAYPLSLVRLLLEAREYHGKGASPIVIHCSAGVGRTGTVMLLDSSLKMADAEGVVDILGRLNKMRQQRINVVETVDQYAFVHRSIVDFFFGDNTKRKVEEFDEYFASLQKKDSATGKTKLAAQFEVLKNITPDFPDRGKSGVDCQEDHDCAKELSSLWSNISSLYLSGYGTKIGYIVVPYPEKPVDFWRRVYSSGSQSVVFLESTESSNNKKWHPFWPDSGSLPLGDYRVDHVISETNGGSLTKTFNLSKRSELKNERTVKQFQLVDLRPKKKEHFSLETFLQLLRNFTRWRQLSGNKLVTIVSTTCPVSIGGFSGGVFLTDMISEDHEVDVLLAARTLRHIRPAFVPCLESYQWLYEVANALSKNIVTHF